MPETYYNRAWACVMSNLELYGDADIQAYLVGVVKQTHWWNEIGKSRPCLYGNEGIQIATTPSRRRGPLPSAKESIPIAKARTAAAAPRAKPLTVASFIPTQSSSSLFYYVPTEQCASQGTSSVAIGRRYPGLVPLHMKPRRTRGFNAPHTENQCQ
jgi:hypothetical protein